MAKHSQQPSLPGFEPEPPQPTAPAEPAPPAQAAPPLEPAAATPPPKSLQGQVVWIVDAHSLIYQVFHALPEMTSPKGEPVAAVYGFMRDLFYLWENKGPDFLFCAFDSPGKTFRHDLFDQYKVQRLEMPDDLKPQIATIRELVAALGIPVLSRKSYEADDILATVARIVEELGGQCVLVTGDKDCRQLLSDKVKIYNIRKNQLYDREALKDDWGIAPRQVVDFQALVGDTSDNVPGVPLIGPKFARDLLEKYQTLDAVLERAEEVSGQKRRENLIAYRDQALLSRELARLDCRVPVAIDWKLGRLDGSDRSRAMELFQELGFRSLADKLALLEGQSPPSREPAIEPTYHLVDTPEALSAFLDTLRRQTCISVDTETTGLWPRWAELVGLSFAWKDDEAWYLPLRAPEGEPHLDPASALEALRGVLEDPAVAKVGQNLKYDMIVLRAAGVEMAGLDFDTMVASYLLDAGERNHNLNDLAKRYLHHATIKIEELIGAGKNQKRMDQVPVRQVADYAGEDAVLPWRLRPILQKKMEEAELERLFDEVEIPLVDVLAELEYQGIKVDVSRLAELSERYGKRLEELQEEIYALAGHPLNIASPKQLQQVLFEEQGLPVVKKTAKTGPSTDVEVLEELARGGHPLPAKLLEYRQYAKLKGTYVDALPKMVHPETGRVHASFHQVVAATGRLSSSDPNLQNIPVRTQQGREIRSAFVPDRDDWVLLAADYSQVELRVLAHFSGDRRLCEAFARDEDIHARVASEVNGVPLAEVTPEMRRAAKAVNFGVVYGQSAFGLARSLGIERDEAAAFIDSYFAQYPGIDGFLTQVLADARKHGYVKTILGRRRAIRGIRENAGRQRNLAERTAVNTVIQGSAADLIKVAMVAIHRRLRAEHFPARMLLQVHDELIFEVPRAELPQLIPMVRREMAEVAALAVPLKVDLKAGPNWADMEACG